MQNQATPTTSEHEVSGADGAQPQRQSGIQRQLRGMSFDAGQSLLAPRSPVMMKGGPESKGAKGAANDKEVAAPVAHAPARARRPPMNLGVNEHWFAFAAGAAGVLSSAAPGPGSGVETKVVVKLMPVPELEVELEVELDYLHKHTECELKAGVSTTAKWHGVGLFAKSGLEFKVKSNDALRCMLGVGVALETEVRNTRMPTLRPTTPRDAAQVSIDPIGYLGRVVGRTMGRGAALGGATGESAAGALGAAAVAAIGPDDIADAIFGNGLDALVRAEMDPSVAPGGGDADGADSIETTTNAGGGLERTVRGVDGAVSVAGRDHRTITRETMDEGARSGHLAPTHDPGGTFEVELERGGWSAKVTVESGAKIDFEVEAEAEVGSGAELEAFTAAGVETVGGMMRDALTDILSSVARQSGVNMEETQRLTQHLTSFTGRLAATASGAVARRLVGAGASEGSLSLDIEGAINGPLQHPTSIEVAAALWHKRGRAVSSTPTPVPGVDVPEAPMAVAAELALKTMVAELPKITFAGRPVTPAAPPRR